jgi:hypothetical protein
MLFGKYPMKVTLPLAYMIGFRSSRGAKSPPAPVHVWKNADFDIASYGSVDVHLVAEWRQAYGKATLEAGPQRVGSWKSDLANDGSLARLVKIDGQFYLPVRGVGQGGFGVGSIGMFADTLAEDIYRTKTKYALGDQQLSDLGYYRLRQAQWTPNAAGTEGSPDLRGKAIDFDEYEVEHRNLRAVLATMAFVDGVLFHQVSEPVIVIAVSVHDGVETAALKIGYRRDYAWPSREIYFPLRQFELARRHLEENWPDSVANAKVSDLAIFIQEVLSPDMEQAEAERGISHFVEETGDILRFLDKEAADIWFELRDVLRAHPDGLDIETIDEMSAKIVAFTKKVERTEDLADGKKETLRFGRMLTERWQLRMIEDDQGFTI